MKTIAFLCPLLARALSLASILLSLNPTSAAEIIDYRQVCPRDGSPCRMVPVYRQSAPVVLIDVVAARPEEYVSFAADSGELPVYRAPISFASQTVIVDQSFPAVSSVASITATPSLAGSGNCGCAVNGVCTCGTNCACANCPCASMRTMLASPLTTTYTTTSYAAANSAFSLPADHTTRQHRRFDRLNRRAVKYGLQ